MKSIVLFLLLSISSTSFGQVNFELGVQGMADFVNSPSHYLQNRYTGYGFEMVLSHRVKNSKFLPYYSFKCNRTIEKSELFFYKNIANEVQMIAQGNQLSIGTGTRYEIIKNERFTFGVSFGYSFMFVDSDYGMMYRISDGSRIVLSYYTGPFPYGNTVYPSVKDWEGYTPNNSAHQLKRPRQSLQFALYGEMRTKSGRSIGLTASMDKYLAKNYGGFSLSFGCRFSLLKPTNHE